MTNLRLPGECKGIRRVRTSAAGLPKTAWNNFANDPGTQIIAGFCPTQGQAVPAKGNDGAFLVCALITASQQPDLYMLWLYSQGKAPAFNGQHRIAAVTKANPPAPGQNWNIP